MIQKFLFKKWGFFKIGIYFHFLSKTVSNFRKLSAIQRSTELVKTSTTMIFQFLTKWGANFTQIHLDAIQSVNLKITTETFKKIFFNFPRLCVVHSHYKFRTNSRHLFQKWNANTSL